MISIDNLIFNTLLTGDKVYLPKVGTLGITRLGALQLDSGNIVPPSSSLVFSEKKEAGAANVKELIAQVAGEGEDPKELYAGWLAKAKSEGRVAIEGVGVIEGLEGGSGSGSGSGSSSGPEAGSGSGASAGSGGATVTADDGFFSLLNPQMETRTGGRNRSGAWLLTLCILLFILLILAVAWHYGLFRPRPSQPAVITRTDTTATAGATATAPAGAANAAGAADKPDSSASTAPAATPAPAPSATAPAQTAKFYVVAGIFRLEKGADARVKSATKEFSGMEKEFPGLKVEKIAMPDGKFMVVIFKGDTRGQAQHIVNRLYYSVDNELWIWERK